MSLAPHEPRPDTSTHTPRALWTDVLLWCVLALSLLAAATLGLSQLSALEPFKVALTVVAGLGGIVALVVAYRKQRVTEEDAARAHRQEATAIAELERQHAREDRAHEREQRDEERARQRDLRDRYGTAAAQLGHEEPTVRLAGVYALANLADDWQEQRQQCVDVLCGYLRLPWTPDQPSADEPAAANGDRPDPSAPRVPYRPGEQAVRETILHVIAERTHRTKERDVTGGPWSDLDYNLEGAVLPDLDWSRSVFTSRLRFRDATFLRSACFSPTFFVGGVDFERTTFCGRGRRGEEPHTFKRACFGTPNHPVFNPTRTHPGTTSFRQARFAGQLDLRQAVISHPLSLRGITANAVNLQAAIVRVPFSFEGARVRYAHFEGAQFQERAEIYLNRGHAAPPIRARFTETVFKGNVYGPIAHLLSADQLEHWKREWRRSRPRAAAQRVDQGHSSKGVSSPGPADD